MDAASDSLVDCLVRSGSGDRKAFARLYDLTAPRLYGLSLKICREASVAEDVLQEAFVRIWRHAHRFEPDRGQPMAWLCTIVRFLAIDTVRRRRPESPLGAQEEIDELQDEAPDPLANTILSEESRVVRGCLEALAEAQRLCIRLAYFNGYTHQQVRARLGVPLGTVKSHIRRGLLQLKRCLES